MNTERFKNSKPFGLWDIAIYLTVALLVFVLFLVFIIIPHFSEKDGYGFIVECDGNTVITYHYGSENFNVNEDFISRVEITKTEGGYEVTLYTSLDKSGFNTLLVNERDKTVKMLNSDCRSKQCTYLHAIGGSGIIYCAPRLLKITPLGGSGFVPPTTG
ncbi:MAG: hypothetical protein IJX16_02990 [Clostridia bacterium]|nr:hypothetical protein [Clostridia bacterium]